MAFDGFKMLPGGLHTAILPMKDDPVHWSVLGQALGAAVEYEAKAHDANFNRAAFGKVIEAVKADEVQAWFLLAGWDVCRPKIIGAAVEFPTILTHWDGEEFEHRHAIYQEDTALPLGMLKELAKERPIGKCFPPNIGLGEYFEQERIRLRTGERAALSGMMSAGRVGEFSPHNTKMIRVMDECGARLGTEHNGAIFELNGLMQGNLDRWQVPVRVENLLTHKNSQAPLPYVFLVGWESIDSKQKIVASFTKGISTFTGETIIRTQVTSNGNLPTPEALKHVMASILTAGQEEAASRKWGAAKYQTPPSPIIAIHGGDREALAGLLTSNKAELLIPHAANAPIFGTPAPTMRIHALGEPQIVASMAQELPKRLLGPHPMLATDQYFKGAAQAVRPLCVACDLRAANAPYFRLCLAA